MTTKNTIAEYVWYDALGQLRSKTKVIPEELDSVNPEFPEWNFDGSSTGLTHGFNSDVALKPVSHYRDPFRRDWPNANCYLVMCQCYNIDGTPDKSNYRVACAEVCERAKEHESWFGIEQEYFIMENSGDPSEPEKPLGWKSRNCISHKFKTQTIPMDENSGLTSAPAYCGLGSDRVCGRRIMEEHMECCLYAGLGICGMNFEVVKAQMEAQFFAKSGLDLGDQLWMGRYILNRIAEKHNTTVELAPKPIDSVNKGIWDINNGNGTNLNGSGSHMNFSTKSMREEGYIHIIEACEKICAKSNANPEKYLAEYGDLEENKKRLSGTCETSDWKKCSYKESDRGEGIRIPYLVHSNKGKKGSNNYLEDRRPSSDCDPYRVAAQLIRTVCLNE